MQILCTVFWRELGIQPRTVVATFWNIEGAFLEQPIFLLVLPPRFIFGFYELPASCGDNLSLLTRSCWKHEQLQSKSGGLAFKTWQPCRDRESPQRNWIRMSLESVGWLRAAEGPPKHPPWALMRPQRAFNLSVRFRTPSGIPPLRKPVIFLKAVQLDSPQKEISIQE